MSPQTGELLPEAMGGTMFSVNFTPSVYGRMFKGKLIIQVGVAGRVCGTVCVCVCVRVCVCVHRLCLLLN